MIVANNELTIELRLQAGPYPSLVERVSFGKKDTLGRGVGHGDREKTGTRAEEKVLWCGAGFSWKFGAWGAQWGGQEETPRRGEGSAQGRGVRG